MKILALADRPIRENLLDMIELHKVDLILLLGDLKYVNLQILSLSHIPIIGVYGNHCSLDYFPLIQADSLHLQKKTINEYSFYGFEGCPLYKGGSHEYSQESAESLMANSPKADILISHSPATGLNSTIDSPHDGFSSLLTYIDLYSPLIHFHGHSYPDEEQKISVYKDTIVYFVNGIDIIDTNILIKNKNSYPKAKIYGVK